MYQTNILKIKIFYKQDCCVDITIDTNFTTSQQARADHVYKFFEVKDCHSCSFLGIFCSLTFKFSMSQYIVVLYKILGGEKKKD